MKLKISEIDGKVSVSCPSWVTTDEALTFAERHIDWILEVQQRVPSTIYVQPGVRIPIEGREYTIYPSSVEAVTLSEDKVLVPDFIGIGIRVATFLKNLCMERVIKFADLFSDAVGRPYDTITLRDPRSRWGSCTHGNNLMFSWRIIMAPPSALRYLVAHEVAHLVEMNHSERFWNLVTEINGPWEKDRNYFRQEANNLHRYNFCHVDRSFNSDGPF